MTAPAGNLVAVTVTAAPQDAQRRSSEPLWRALAVFRFASLGYAALRLAVIDRDDYSRPDWAWVVIAVMAAWTIATTIAYARPERRTRLLLSADLVVTAGLLLSTAALQYLSAMRHGVTPVTATWLAGPVLAWAVRYGRRAGAITALIMSGCVVALVRAAAFSVALNGVVLLLLAGVVVGHLARLAAEVEAERQHVIEVEAASRERERLARDIHDSVLQVLALVQRRGAEAGGAAAELGRLAGQQEAALRVLVGRRTGAGPAGGPAPGAVDLCAVILPAQTDRVTVSVPAQAVLVDPAAADELASATHAALDNVRRHCGEQARAWVLVEDELGLVTVTIRDDGPGIPEGRLSEAAAAGRLGVSHSIHGRLRDLGGSATISSVPGEGTEIELRLPRGAGGGAGGGVTVARSPEQA
jgi:signal transduction histidine kinase